MFSLRKHYIELHSNYIEDSSTVGLAFTSCSEWCIDTAEFNRETHSREDKKKGAVTDIYSNA
jgi:hypothetical protein